VSDPFSRSSWCSTVFSIKIGARPCFTFHFALVLTVYIQSNHWYKITVKVPPEWKDLERVQCTSSRSHLRICLCSSVSKSSLIRVVRA
jgi:hypothetical protein